MRGAMWWIDRWRKSSAYMDMTAEEQGLYRNLLDEVWLREDHVIPNVPRILARCSGDPEAWERSGPKVLKWMVAVDGGWTNETALEVIEKAKQGADRQRRYRERQRNGERNGERATPVTKAVLRSPSPSPSPKEQPPTGGAAPRAAKGRRLRGESSWSREAVDDWLERFPGSAAPGGRIGKALEPLVKRHGWEHVRQVWRFYLLEERADFLNPQTFASKYGEYERRARGGRPGDTPGRAHRSEQALARLTGGSSGRA